MLNAFKRLNSFKKFKFTDQALEDPEPINLPEQHPGGMAC
jgi:hypothetical protein